MADSNTLQFKLIIDGKEAVATLDVVKGEFIETGETAENSNQKIKQSYQGLINEAAKYNTVTDATVGNLYNYIQTQELSVDIIQKTIQALQVETDILPVNSAAWKQKMAAADNLRMSLAKVNSSHVQLGNTQKSAIPGVNNMTQAVGQFGWVLGDANMFMVNARMGMMSIANNIPMVVQAFAQARTAAAGQATAMQQITAAIMGGGGLMLGINALMFLLQVLPALFDDTTKAAEEHKGKIKELADEYKNLAISKLEAEIRLLEAEKMSAELDIEVNKPVKEMGVTVFVNGADPEVYEKAVSDLEKIDERLNVLNDKLEQSAQSFKSIMDGGYEYRSIDNVTTAINTLQKELNSVETQESRDEISAMIEKLEELKKTMTGVDEKDKTGFAEKKLKALHDLAKAETETQTKRELAGKTYAEMMDVLTSAEADHASIVEDIRNASTAEELEAAKKVEELNEVRIAAIEEELEVYLKVTDEKYKAGQKELDRIRRQSEAELEFEKKKQEFQNSLPSQLTTNEFELRQASLDAEKAVLEQRLEEYGLYEQYKYDVEAYFAERSKQLQEQKYEAMAANAVSTLNFIASAFDKYSTVAKVAAVVEATWNTYKAANVALAAAPPPFNYVLMAGVIAAGLKNVSQIIKAEPPKMGGFFHGGRLPKGKAGIVEGTRNELIAPEEDFITVVNDLVGRSIIESRNFISANTTAPDQRLVNEITSLRSELKEMASRPSIAYFNDREARKLKRFINELDSKQGM
ncbi:MAG: hypothetical protein K9I99_03795 [Melioribacteraceae bacterium]|nr:hypothetical protein [Melioribacteraceae bacterium]